MLVQGDHDKYEHCIVKEEEDEDWKDKGKVEWPLDWSTTVQVSVQAIFYP